VNAGGQIGNRADAAEFSLVDDRDAVAERFGIGQNVSGEENGFAFVLELFHQVAHFAPAHGIEAGHGFVEENELGIMQNGLRGFPTRCNMPLENFRNCTPSHRAGRRVATCWRRAASAPWRDTRELRVIVFRRLVRGEVIVEIRLLGKETDLRLHFRVGSNRGPEGRADPEVGKDQSHQQLQGCSFAGAVWDRGSRRSRHPLP